MQKTLEVGGELKRSLVYVDQLPEFIFGSLVSMSHEVLQCYQSDWYYDALFIKKAIGEYVKLPGGQKLILDYFYRETGTHLIVSEVTESLLYAQYNDFGIRVTIKPYRLLPGDNYYDVVYIRLLLQKNATGSGVHAEFA